jgi:hypothetical protein
MGSLRAFYQCIQKMRYRCVCKAVLSVLPGQLYGISKFDDMIVTTPTRAEQGIVTFANDETCGRKKLTDDGENEMASVE